MLDHGLALCHTAPTGVAPSGHEWVAKLENHGLTGLPSGRPQRTMQVLCRRVETLMEGRMSARTLLISVAVAMAASGIAIAGWNAGGLSQPSAPRLAGRRPSAIPLETETV